MLVFLGLFIVYVSISWCSSPGHVLADIGHVLADCVQVDISFSEQEKVVTTFFVKSLSLPIYPVQESITPSDHYYLSLIWMYLNTKTCSDLSILGISNSGQREYYNSFGIVGSTLLSTIFDLP
jgi:uncharacterized protein YjfI (DUF2170 family)